MMVAIVMIVVFGCMSTCFVAFTGTVLANGGSPNAGLALPYVCNILCTGAGACAVFGTLRWANDYMNIKDKQLISY
jgi:hypothetical protein